MKAESLMASAAINFGIALVILSLFSVLKKQPFIAPIYFSRRIAAGEELPLDRRFSFSRLRPSVSWITLAFRLSEEDVIRQRGLDALVVIRLFKLGIKFFTVCCFLGLLILVPVNYASQKCSTSNVISHSMDSFTISNVQKGSNRLWVHFSCLCIVTFYALFALYMEYKGVLNKRIHCIGNQRYRPDYFTILVRGIPLCEEHNAHGCSVDHFFLKHYPSTYQAFEMIFEGKKVEELQQQAASIERNIVKSHQKPTNQPFKGFINNVFCGIFQSHSEDPKFHEEKLKEICQRIRVQQCEIHLKAKEFPAAFVSFKSRMGATIATETQQHAHPLLWITESAPEPNEVIWKNVTIPYRNLVILKIAVFSVASILTIFFALPVTAIQGLVQFEKFQKWFPPIRAMQPGLTSILTGYLPSAILNFFIYVVPYAMLALASLEGCVSKSKQEIKTCSMVFYFLLGNVFYLSLLSGSLLDQIGESFTHPRDFPSHLASAVSTQGLFTWQSGFFITYILTDGLSGFSLELLQLGLILWHFIRSPFDEGTTKDPYLFGFPYYRVIPTVSLAILIGMVYAVIAPLLLPFIIIYFLVGYAVYVNQMQDVYKIVYDTHGQYWPHIHHYIIITILLMQLTMIGLFGLKSKPAASISTVVLVLLTVLFNEYCKIRFLPSFQHRPIQIAKEMDDQELEVENEINQAASAIHAYRPPWMRPATSQVSSSIEPLLSSA